MAGPGLVGKWLRTADGFHDEGFRNDHGKWCHEGWGKLSGLRFHPIRHAVDDDTAFRVTTAWKRVLIAVLAARASGFAAALRA